MEHLLFSEKMRLADLIYANHNLILMLPRFGIPLGFGDKSVSAVCEEYHVPADFFILICNVYTFEDYIPDRDCIRKTDMSMLVSYLLASHQYYLQEHLEHIEHHLFLLADTVDEKYGRSLKFFFSDYKNEVIEHFDYEEKNVFPYLKSLLSGSHSSAFSIRQFKESHSNIEDKLNDLIQIIFKYLPGNVKPYDSIDMIFDIFQLSADLDKHTLIENKILIPYVEFLEQKK